MTEVLLMASERARRDRLENALRDEPTIHLAGVAPTFPFLRSLMNETEADVVLVDLQPVPDSPVSREWLVEMIDLVGIVLLCSTADPVLFDELIHVERGAMLRS